MTQFILKYIVPGIIFHLALSVSAFPNNEKLFSDTAYYQSGLKHLNKGEFGKAYYAFQNYLSLVEDSSFIYAQRCYEIGHTFKRNMFFNEALTYFKSGVEQVSSTNTRLELEYYFGIYGTFYQLHQYDSSLVYAQKCLKLALQLNDTIKLISSYNNFGECERLTGNFENSRNYYSLSLELNRHRQARELLGLSYMNISSSFLMEDKLSNAKKYLDSAARHIFIYHNSINRFDTILIVELNTLHGDYYSKLNNYKPAIKHYQKALEYSDNVESNEAYSIIYQGLAENYAKTQQLDSTVKYFQKKIDFISTTCTESILEERTQFRLQLETQEISQQISYLEEKAVQQARKKRVLLWIFIGSLIILSGLIIILIYIQKLRTRNFEQSKQLLEKQNKLKVIENQKLILENKELENRERIKDLERLKLVDNLSFKNKELSTFSMHIINKNEVLNKINFAMNNLQYSVNEEDSKKIKEVMNMIGNNLNVDEDWNTFKLHFENVHEGFFSRLKEKYPDLTFEELKLCAYLRIRLTSKEIARILNITPPSVNKKRNRLRKKINIEPKEDLVEFIAQI